jgi:hypothetical protein
LVDAIAINRKHGNIFGGKPETGNKVPLQVLATQQCNLLPETKKFITHALTGLPDSGKFGVRNAELQQATKKTKPGGSRYWEVWVGNDIRALRSGLDLAQIGCQDFNL